MKYIEKYNRYIDDDCVIYRKNKEGKLVQVKVTINNSGYGKCRWRERTSRLLSFKIQEKEFDCEGRNDKA